MSPIRNDNKNRYPLDWKAISLRVKERAGWRCECEGHCGKDHGGRCIAVHGGARQGGGRPVILTVAHLDHEPENCGEDNLKACCEGCHLRLDLDQHVKNASRTRDIKNNVGQGVLF